MGRTIHSEFWRGKNHFERKVTATKSVCLMNGVVITEAHYYEALRNRDWSMVMKPVLPQTASDLEWAKHNHLKV